MKIQRRSIVTGSVAMAVAILVALGISMAGSSGELGARWAYAGIFKHGCPGGFGGNFMKALVLANVDDMAERLELTEDQNARFKEIRARLEDNIDLGKERRRAFFNNVKAEVNAADPDMNGLVGMLKAKISEIPGHVSENLDLFLEFYDILDENQKTQLIQTIRDHFEKCDS